MSDVCACPSCGRRLRLPENTSDKAVRCPVCKEVFTPTVDPPTPVGVEEGGLPRPVAHREESEDEKQDSYSRERAPRHRDDREEIEEDPRPRRRRSRRDEEEEEWRPGLPNTLPGKGLGIALVVLLGLNILVDVGSSVVDAVQLSALAADKPGDDADDEPINVIACLSPFVLLPTAVLFAMWMYRSYKNLLDMGIRGLAYSPGWAAGSLFVPILNLFRPCQIAQEMWRASTPDLEEDRPRSWRKASGSVVIGFWWAFWIISNLLYNGSFRTIFSNNPEEVRLGTVVGMMANGVACLAGLFAILMVLGLRRRQEAKLDRLWELEE
jgi:hypothetical protein